MIRKLKITLVNTLTITALLLGMFPAAAMAAPCPAQGNFLSFPNWWKYLDSSETIAGKCTPIINNNGHDIILIIVAVVEILLRIVGIAAVGFVVYGGFKYILSQGQPDATKNARQTIQNALIGVAISLIASIAVSFFGKAIS